MSSDFIANFIAKIIAKIDSERVKKDITKVRKEEQQKRKTRFSYRKTRKPRHYGGVSFWSWWPDLNCGQFAVFMRCFMRSLQISLQK